jgi:glycosyltransferase involved in cell wall biosynthesis
LAGIIARLTEQKAHRYLFDAMASTPELSALHLLVVGDGDLREELRAQVERLGLASRVHFLGARRDLGDLLAAVDLFVMPSLWEGLPLSMVLAMGAGLPVVATSRGRHSGSRAGRRDRSSCRRPTCRRFGAALARLVADPALRRTMGTAAASFVRPRFGVDGYVTALTALYDRLLVAEGRA